MKPLVATCVLVRVSTLSGHGLMYVTLKNAVHTRNDIRVSLSVFVFGTKKDLVLKKK